MSLVLIKVSGKEQIKSKTKTVTLKEMGQNGIPGKINGTNAIQL
jgi:hypothetical protein